MTEIQSNSPSRQKGFTLIELMITVAVIGVLSALALPTYKEYMDRQKRADAQTQLLAAKLWLERNYSANMRYDDPASPGAAPPGFSTQLFTKSPTTGTANYAISLSAVARNSYTLTATRAGAMATDACGNFTLDNNDTKGLASQPSGSTKTLADCWR